MAHQYKDGDVLYNIEYNTAGQLYPTEFQVPAEVLGFYLQTIWPSVDSGYYDLIKIERAVWHPYPTLPDKE